MAAGVMRMTAPISNAVLVRSPVLYMCVFGASNGHGVFAMHPPVWQKETKTQQPNQKKNKQQQTNPSPALLTERKNLLAVSEVWDVPGSDEQDSGVVAEV